MKLTAWHILIALALIACFLGLAAFIGYLLYGPSLTFEIPKLFGNTGTTTPAAAEETRVPPADPLAPYPGVRFDCTGGRSLKAEFLSEKVTVSLSDGRRVSLPQTSAEAGARYANTNESFVFRTKDYGASLEEKGVVTYGNCVMRP